MCDGVVIISLMDMFVDAGKGNGGVTLDGFGLFLVMAS